MQMVGTITRNKVFEILWLYVAKLLKGKKKKKVTHVRSRERLKRYGAGTSKYETKMVQAYILVSLRKSIICHLWTRLKLTLDY